jgi:hypothetical protein
MFFRTVTTALLLVMVAGGDSRAQPAAAAPITFFYLKSATPGENSSLSGECDGSTLAPEVTCRFTQLMVRYKLDPKELPSELEKRLKQLRAEVGGNPKGFVARMCAEFHKSRSEVEQEIKTLTNPHAKARAQDFFSVCSNPTPTMNALESWIRRATIAESKSCEVSVFQNDPVTFKKIAPNKWVANVGPQGSCSSIYLYTRENDPQHATLWKWSQVRTYADRSEPHCKHLQLNYRSEYSWQGNDPDLTCETLSFGR